MRADSRAAGWISPLLVALSLVAIPDLAEASVAPADPGWVSRYDGPRHRNDLASEIAVSPDGSRVFVSGDSYRPGCGNWATVAYDSSDGQELWSARYDGAEHWCDNVAGIAVSDDGERLYVTGTAEENDAGDIVTIAYDSADGSQLWMARETRPDLGADTAADVATLGSNVYVVGTVNTSCDASADICYYSLLVASYDGLTGHRRWVDEHDAGGGNNFGVGITAGASNAVYVAATTSGRVEALAYDGATGTRRWVVQSDDTYYPTDIFTTPDGTTVLIPAFSDEHYSLTAYASGDGSELWSTHRGDGNFGAPFAAVAPAGDSVYLTGETRDDYRLWAIESGDGSVQWRAGYKSEGRLSDYPFGVAVKSDGAEVVVTGSLGRPGSWGSVYGIVAFDTANGEALWVDKYGYGASLGGDHYATAIAAAPEGGIYITGASDGPTGWQDFATISYG